MLALGFLEIEQGDQLEARQAIELDVAGECRHSRIVLGSLVSVVDDSGSPGRDINCLHEASGVAAIPSVSHASLRRAQIPSRLELRCRGQGRHG